MIIFVGSPPPKRYVKAGVGKGTLSLTLNAIESLSVLTTVCPYCLLSFPITSSNLLNIDFPP